MKVAKLSPCGFAGPTDGLSLTVLRSSDPGREQAEQFIHRVFALGYGANVTLYMPKIMILRSQEQQLLAALGIRFAQSNNLFLEQYLDGPAEQVVAGAAHTAVARSSVVELGNLASHQRGGLRCLIIGLTAYLKGAGIKWATFTAVPAVRNAFVKMGIPLFDLGFADRTRLPRAAADWGTYYDHQPRVVAGNVEAAYDYIAGALSAGTMELSSCCLWEGAFRMGIERRSSGGLGLTGALKNAGC